VEPITIAALVGAGAAAANIRNKGIKGATSEAITATKKVVAVAPKAARGLGRFFGSLAQELREGAEEAKKISATSE